MKSVTPNINELYKHINVVEKNNIQLFNINNITDNIKTLDFANIDYSKKKITNQSAINYNDYITITSTFEKQQESKTNSQSEMATLCEIGSVPLDGSEWLVSAVTTFQQSYGELHPYLAAALCIIGTLMNIITVIVLTRKSMISPVNVLLCAVAICDIVVMSSYLIFVWHFLFAAASRCTPSDYSYAWAIFTMFHAHASVIFHATSIWLTVSLAQIRVLTIRRATIGPAPNISERFTAILAVATYLIMSLVNLPNFLTFEIMQVPSSFFLSCLKSTISYDKNLSDSTVSIIENENNMSIIMNHDSRTLHTTPIPQTLFSTFTVMPTLITNSSSSLMVNFTGIANNVGIKADETTVFTVRAHENDCMKLKLAFWSNGMVFKVVPCLLLTVSIVSLLNIIADVAHKRKNLAQVMKKKVPKDHTTPMLAAVLSIFLIAELPQGVMLVLTGIFSSETFHKKIYLPLGDFMDLLSLLNSAIGFLIYVGMSRKFRSVFFQLLFSCLRCVFSPTSSGHSFNNGWRDDGCCRNGWHELHKAQSQQQSNKYAQQRQRQQHIEWEFCNKRGGHIRQSETTETQRNIKKTTSTADNSIDAAVAQSGTSCKSTFLCNNHTDVIQRRERRCTSNHNGTDGRRATANTYQRQSKQKPPEQCYVKRLLLSPPNMAHQNNRENIGRKPRKQRIHERAIRFLFFGRRRYYEYYRTRHERNAEQYRRRFTAATTTTECTKTEQLSGYYPCNASTLNASAAATVAAAASLGSHLLIFDPFSQLLSNNNKENDKDSCSTSDLILLTSGGCSKKISNAMIVDKYNPFTLEHEDEINSKKIPDILSTITPTSAPRTSNDKQIKCIHRKESEFSNPVKRISFSMVNATSEFSDNNINMVPISRTKSNMSEQRESTVKLVGVKKRRAFTKNYCFLAWACSKNAKRDTKNESVKNNQGTEIELKSREKNTFKKRLCDWFITNLQSPTELHPREMDSRGSMSPGRRMNILRTESHFFGSIY